jgi:hypothetical protein
MTKRVIKKVTLGADPELFVEKLGEIVSAEGMIGGTKEEPKVISEKGHAIQEDNVMVEFNIPPCSTEDEFVEELEFVEEYLEQLVALKGCKLNYSASAELDEKYLQTEQAKRFGCDPDLNVYLKDINKAPDADTNLRTCGGHIHIGYENPDLEVSEEIVIAMDIMLGLPSVSIDEDNRRKEMYGAAGCFRFKDYGVEYRSLSNFWLKTEELKRWAFNKTMEAIDLVNSGIVPDLLEMFGENIKEAIDTNNEKLAKETIEGVEAYIKEHTLVKV